MNTIGARMRAARETARLSQTDVASELGVTKGSLSAWENDRNYPQLQAFMRLCELYGTSADALLFAAAPAAAPAAHVHYRVAEPRTHYDAGVTSKAHRAIDALSEMQVRGLLLLLGVDKEAADAGPMAGQGR
ncbi:transcriptional regulator with XRE-family HTH domain [Xanthomonas sp. F1]|uniref:helix-turn-helix domain-containing protein n=1 Tax=Xanthomonas sp. LMG 8992 TaxID=1591157 RepID=UPI00136D4F2B